LPLVLGQFIQDVGGDAGVVPNGIRHRISQNVEW
jgi:hypothetical protein